MSRGSRVVWPVTGPLVLSGAASESWLKAVTPRLIITGVVTRQDMIG